MFFIVTIALLCSFVSAQPLHALIPHSHGVAGVSSIDEDGPGHCHAGDASGDVTPMWSFIHASLAHECKKTPLPLSGIQLLTILLLMLGVRAVQFLPATERRLSNQYEQLLSRGVFAFRKFG